jgi:tRNA threonylcarbamoyladenosine biosynthesis protein TsaB
MRVRSVLLAIDTATEQAAVAVGDGSRVVETVWSAGRDQTTSTLAQIDRCLGLLGATVADVGGVAVTTGPGMFNGLRVGIGIAKGLALGNDARLFGVPTLAITARPWLGFGRPVAAVAAAGRGRYVWAWVADDGGGDPLAFRNGTLPELVDEVRMRGAAIVAGEVPDDGAAFAGLPGVVTRAGDLGVRRGGAALALAWPRFAAGEADDAATLEPVYLHAARDVPAGAG